jgi:hypothetical protein
MPKVLKPLAPLRWGFFYFTTSFLCLLIVSCKSKACAIGKKQEKSPFFNRIVVTGNLAVCLAGVFIKMRTNFQQ